MHRMSLRLILVKTQVQSYLVHKQGNLSPILLGVKAKQS